MVCLFRGGEHPAALAFLAEGLAVTGADAVAVVDADSGLGRADIVPLGADSRLDGHGNGLIDHGFCLGVGLRHQNGHRELRLAGGVIEGGLCLKNVYIGKTDVSDCYCCHNKILLYNSLMMVVSACLITDTSVFRFMRGCPSKRSAHWIPASASCKQALYPSQIAS